MWILSERVVNYSKRVAFTAQIPMSAAALYFTLTRVVQGKTQSHFLTLEQATIVRFRLRPHTSFGQK